MRPSDESAVYFKAREYTVYRKERSLRGGGGVAILVREGIFSTEITQDIYYNTDSIAIMIKYGTRNLLIACMYRAPDSQLEYSNNIMLSIKNYVSWAQTK